MMSAIWRTISGASPSLGSSSSISRGLATSARAIASICCSPPDNCVPPLLAARGEIGEILEDALRWSSRRRPAGRAAMARFSSTESEGKIARVSCTKAMRARATSNVASALMSRPSNVTRPRRGCTMRMIERSVVVLPAPLRPSSATTLPAGTSSETPWMMWESPR